MPEDPKPGYLDNSQYQGIGRLIFFALMMGAIAIAGLLSYFVQWRAARMCDRFTSGMGVADVLRVADSHRMKSKQVGDSTYFVELGVNGRGRCRLAIKDGLLKSSAYESQE
jgi:hypothetical protein